MRLRFFAAIVTGALAQVLSLMGLLVHIHLLRGADGCGLGYGAKEDQGQAAHRAADL